MIEVTAIKIDTLNGSHLQKWVRVPATHRFFTTREELEQFRTKKETKLQYKSDQAYRADNPGATEEDMKHAPKVSVLFDLKIHE